MSHMGHDTSEHSLPHNMVFMISRSACSDAVSPTLKLTKVLRDKLAHLKNKLRAISPKDDRCVRAALGLFPVCRAN